MAPKKLNIAIAGATGAVGNQMIRCLEEMDFPINSVFFLASKRSVGRQIRFKGDLIDVMELKKDAFKGIDIALFFSRWRHERNLCPLRF
jgi:aspartate-semialdehyde dehydrogenase